MYINIIINVIDMKMFLMKFLLTILIFYGMYALFFYFRQGALIYPAGFAGQRLQVNDVSIEKSFIAAGENKSETWFLPPLHHVYDKAPVLLIAHGNATLIDAWHAILDDPREHGFAVLLAEYPGYGDSQGSPSQKNITDIFIKAYQALLERNDVDSERIIFMGRSLGGGVICSLAEHYQPAAIVLLSTFTSVKSFAGKFFLPAFLVTDPYNNAEFLKTYDGPLMLVHGRNDQVIAYSHFKELMKIRTDAFTVTYNSDHNDTPPLWEEFWEKFYKFALLHNLIGKESL